MKSPWHFMYNRTKNLEKCSVVREIYIVEFRLQNSWRHKSHDKSHDESHDENCQHDLWWFNFFCDFKHDKAAGVWGAPPASGARG